jgi:lysophospholipase L1-like esterase
MRNLLFIFFLCSFTNVLWSQDELKWQGVVETIISEDHDFDAGKKGLIILTGSSSARMWQSFADVVPEYNSRNYGFGGSQMHELLFFLDKLVLQHKPDKVLIYEGDNDISAGKSSDQIIATTKEVIKRIRAELPETEIYLISPKPSLARWELADQYVELNRKMEEYCATTENLTFIDVWNPMLNSDGRPIEDIFIEDGLHMNQKGYDIWEAAVAPLLK